MKTLRLIAAVALLAIPCGAANAADFALFGAIMDTDDFDSSVGLGIKVDFPLGGAGWGLEFRGAYYPELGSNLNEFIEDADVDADAFELSATPLDIGITYGLGEMENFFVGAGLSYAFIDADREVAFDDEGGWYLVVGFEGGQEEGGIGFFGEVLYRGMELTYEGTFDDLEAYEIEGKLDGWTVNLGVVWRR